MTAPKLQPQQPAKTDERRDVPARKVRGERLHWQDEAEAENERLERPGYGDRLLIEAGIEQQRRAEQAEAEQDAAIEAREFWRGKCQQAEAALAAEQRDHTFDVGALQHGLDVAEERRREMGRRVDDLMAEVLRLQKLCDRLAAAGHS